MNLTHVGELNLDRYNRLWEKAGGDGSRLFLVSPAGSLLWPEAWAETKGRSYPLGPLAPEALSPEGECDGVRQHVIEGVGRALLAALRNPAGDPVAWLGALAKEQAETGELGALLEDVAACVQASHERVREIEEIASELTLRCEEINLMYDVAERVRRSGRIDDLLQELLAACVEHLDVDLAFFLRTGARSKALYAPEYPPIEDLDLLLVEAAGGLHRYVTTSKQAVVLNDPNDSRRAYLLAHMPYKVISAPVLQGASVQGLLVIVNRPTKRDFLNGDRSLLQLLAQQASIMTEVDGMIRDMRRFSDRMASALIAAVEAKDPYTRGHSERVHEISMRIGRALALEPDELEELHWGSLLHDLGKMAVPDAILRKPGGLSKDERTFIQAHPQDSFEILNPIEQLGGAALGARHHHERFDGAGYPSGLKGSKIPLFARIIAVADTFDAMTSSRAYRSGRSVQEALAELRRVSGTQLDPEIVDVFIGLCREEDPVTLATAKYGDA
ncbi:MAG: HD domain-containing protein [Deltaproteobacteria bacterium]|nr:HD domain-containing protein [Deltaproteobacteria bacterium]